MSRPAFDHSADANVSGDCVGAAALQAKSLLSTALFLSTPTAWWSERRYRRAGTQPRVCCAAVRRSTASAEQNEINEGPANSRRDRPNHEIETFIGRLNIHRSLNLRYWFCPP